MFRLNSLAARLSLRPMDMGRHQYGGVTGTARPLMDD